MYSSTRKIQQKYISELLSESPLQTSSSPDHQKKRNILRVTQVEKDVFLPLCL